MNENLPDNPQIQVLKSGKTGLFTNYIYKAIPLAFDESMSYYETLCGLLSYLRDTVIPALNNNADSIIEVQNLMTELQNYVDNYFDNLDVQQEINNKLDEMAQNGTLTTLISDYMQPFIDNQNDEINNFKNEINRRINIQDNMINSVTNGSPLIASNVTEMTDTTKIYVNTTDGKWYYYNDNDWVIGGTYQGTMLDTVNQNKLNETYSEVINTYQTPIPPRASHVIAEMRDFVSCMA